MFSLFSFDALACVGVWCPCESQLLPFSFRIHLRLRPRYVEQTIINCVLDNIPQAEEDVVEDFNDDDISVLAGNVTSLLATQLATWVPSVTAASRSFFTESCTCAIDMSVDNFTMDCHNAAFSRRTNHK